MCYHNLGTVGLAYVGDPCELIFVICKYIVIYIHVYMYILHVYYMYMYTCIIHVHVHMYITCT